MAKLSRIPIPKPNLSQPAVKHLRPYLSAFPQERTRLVDCLTGPLFELLKKDGDRLEINDWQPPRLPKKGSRSKMRFPPHIHSSVISPRGFYVIDREPFSISDSEQGPKRLHFQYQDFNTSPQLEALFEWVHMAYRRRKNNTFFIIEGDKKNGGRISALQKKHPLLFSVLDRFFQALNDLPPSRVWYPEYEIREREKKLLQKSGGRTGLPRTH